MGEEATLYLLSPDSQHQPADPCTTLGAGAGFLTSIAVGWSRAVGYWVHPVLRLIGPVPAVAWIPIAFFMFPSSRSASTFLIALATFFPVAVLIWSGVASVSAAYYDVARTMGARPWFLVRKVAVPAAMPSVSVGLFMGWARRSPSWWWRRCWA